MNNSTKTNEKESVSTFKKVWNVVSTVLVVIVVIIAVALVGARVFGLRVFSVLSGSMEPKYMTGDLIYVKAVKPETVKAGDDITFVLNEDLVVGTHRVAEVDTEHGRFITYGINNNHNSERIARGEKPETDDNAVLFENLIGKPVFRIPFFGYVSNWIQKPPGLYISIGAAILMLIAVFLPDLVNWQAKKLASRQNGAQAQPSAAEAGSNAPQTGKTPEESSAAPEDREKDQDQTR